MTDGFKHTLIWIFGSMVAVMVSMAMLSAAFDGQHYIPVGDDSFYHARRILDAVANPSGYYEFDPKIHAPQGSLLTWPWAYDLGVAWIIRGCMALGISADAVKIMDYVPVASVPIAIALILTLAVQLRLSLWSQIVAVLCVALSPLVQFLFGVGSIDHHYVEYLFMLAALSAGIGWLQHPQSEARAALVGAVLGIAPAFQNGLFIIQVPLLLALALLHLRGVTLPRSSTLGFAAALVLSTLLMLLHSVPFWQGRFEYYLFSWYHLYVAACSAAFAVLLSILAPNRRSTLILVGAGLLLVAPLAGQMLLGGQYFSAHVEHDFNIAEIQNVFEQYKADGLYQMFRYYGGLLLILPFAIVGCGWYLIRYGRNPVLTLFCVTSVVGLLMLSSKFRLQNFGSFALFLPLLCLVEHRAPADGKRRALVLAALSVLFAAAFYVPVTRQLYAPQWLANSPYYTLNHDIYPSMQSACARKPGIVLASNDDGHYIRYHTDCSVIANNFMLTRDDVASLDEMLRLMSLTPDQLLTDSAPIHYVYVRLNLVIGTNDGRRLDEQNIDSVKRLNWPLVNALIFTPVDQIDRHYKLVQELHWPAPANRPYARLFEIVRDTP